MTYQGGYKCSETGLGAVRIGGSSGTRAISSHIGNQSVARIFVGGNRWPYRPYYPVYYPYVYAYPQCVTPCQPLNIGGYGCWDTNGRLAMCTPQPPVVPINVIGY